MHLQDVFSIFSVNGSLIHSVIYMLKCLRAIIKFLTTHTHTREGEREEF